MDEPLSQQFGKNSNTLEGTRDYISYAEYKEGLPQGYVDEAKSVIIDVKTLVSSNPEFASEDVEGKTAVHWGEDVSQITWTFNIEKEGRYTFALDYYLDGDVKIFGKKKFLSGWRNFI